MDVTRLWGRVKTLEAQMQLAFAKDAQIVGSFWAQGGNSFGATGVLGTLDANDISIIARGAGRQVLGLIGIAAAGNRFKVSGVVAGSSPILQPVGTDAVIGASFLTKSTGAFIFRPGADSTNALHVSNGAGPLMPFFVTSGRAEGAGQGQVNITSAPATNLALVAS